MLTQVRLGRNLLVRRVPGFRSAGHAIIVAAYVAINVSVIFTNVDTTSLGSLASRFGWYVLRSFPSNLTWFSSQTLINDYSRMALANLAVVIFLALKNTPLAFLTAHSYERLNCLHQIAGYTMFVEMVIHASMYTSYFNSTGRLLAVFAERGEIAAIVAGFAFLGVVFSATFLRRFWYELFYITHVCCWIVGVVAVGFHQPEFGEKTLIVTLIAASIWFLDRLLRASRVLYYSVNNEATLHPLANGGTKIVFKKVPARAEPGKHCFIWIPSIRKFETHPFTIHRSSPLAFTVKACNGFTRDLHKYAAAHPGVSVRASIDGPYGTFPDPMEFDKIVLIAGGGGATFTFGLAVNILERMDESSPKDVVFVWSVREHGEL
jgi:predicted ferric reductase